MKLSEPVFNLKLGLILAIYITSLIAANTLSIKLMPFVFGTHLTVAIFSFPIVFLTTDIVGEIYGKPMARMFIWAGFISTLLFIIYTFVSDWMPWSESAYWVKESYNQVFGSSIRISLASLTAFIVAEYQDVVSFFFFRKIWGDKHFWLRSNLSNIWSQLLDSIIFTIIAFAGIYDIPTMVALTIPWWIYKVFMGFLYTPLSYVALHFLREPKKT